MPAAAFKSFAFVSADVPLSHTELNSTVFAKRSRDSDNDLFDEVKILKLNYRINKNNESKISKKQLEKLLRKTLTSKLDIHNNRLKEINIENDFIEVTIDARKSGSSELNVKEVLLKLKNILLTF